MGTHCLATAMGDPKVFCWERAPAMIAVVCGEFRGPLQLVDSILEPCDNFRPIIELAGPSDGPANENRNDAVLIIYDGDGRAVVK